MVDETLVLQTVDPTPRYTAPMAGLLGGGGKEPNNSMACR